MGEASEPQEDIGGVMGQEHDFAVENLPAYVLGALEPQDARRVEQHLQVCAQCREEFQSLSEAASALAYSVPVYDPPSHLRTTLKLSIATPRVPTVAPTGASPALFAVPSRRVPMFLTAMLVVALGLLGWNFHLHSRLNNMQAEMESARALGEVLMEYVEHPDAYDMVLLTSESASKPAKAMVVHDRLGQRVIVLVEGLPTSADNVPYAVWLFDDEGRGVKVGHLYCDAEGRGVAVVHPPSILERIFEIGIVPESEGTTSPLPVLKGRLPERQGLPLRLAGSAL